MEEVWKDVVGFEGRYQISSLGNMRSLTRETTYKNGNIATIKGKPLRVVKGSKNGYLMITLDSARRFTVHRLVAHAFLGTPGDDEKTVNHKDGDKTNNRVENLEWSSYGDNNRHARLRRLNKQFGENCNLTKFDKYTVAAARILHKANIFETTWIAKLLGMSVEHVFEISNGSSRADG